MKRNLLFSVALFAAAAAAAPTATPLFGAPLSQAFDSATIAESRDSLQFSIAGVWVLDSAIISQTDDDGNLLNTATYLLGDSVLSLFNGYEHPQPPQKVIFEANTATFEYSSPVACRTFVEQIRTGQYHLQHTPKGDILRICFRFAEEFVCVRSETGHLNLHYVTYLYEIFDNKIRYTENGVFKFKPANHLSEL